MDSPVENKAIEGANQAIDGADAKVAKKTPAKAKTDMAAKKEFSSSSAPSSTPSSSQHGLNFFQLCKFFPSTEGGGGGQVPTEQYIEAVNSLAEYISKLGLVFWSVRSDITNNCSIVRAYYQKNVAGNKTIEQLIANNRVETTKKKHWSTSAFSNDSGANTSLPLSTTMDALIWVHLSMTFFGYILRDLLTEYDACKSGNGNSARPTEDLVVFFRRAYEKTLLPHSTWLMNSLFEIILKGTPSRTEFLTLAKGSGPNKLTEAEVFEKMRAYCVLLEENNAKVKKAIISNGYSV